MDIAESLDLIPSGIAAEIRLENVFEHLYRYQQNNALEQFKRILKKDGCLIIKWLPDFDNTIGAYLKNEVYPGEELVLCLNIIAKIL